MCQCFGFSASAGEGGGSRDRPVAESGTENAEFAVSAEQRQAALDGAGDQVWIDVHAHPGRCFLHGLADDDLFVRVLGPENLSPVVEQMRAGGVRVASFATVSDLRVLGVDASGGIRAQRDFEPGEAYRDHRRQLQALTDLRDAHDIDAIRSVDDIHAVQESQRIGAILTCEGGDFIEAEPERVQEAYELDVRSITLVHYRTNELGDIQTEMPVHNGLTEIGAEVVREMNRLGMIIDLAHATFAVTKAVVEMSAQPVMVSHSHLVTENSSHPRLLTPEHARIVADADGLIGAWPAGVAISGFAGYIDEIFRLADLVGIDHVAIGTDMDANYRPVVSSYAQFPDIAACLLVRGMAREEVAQVLGGNFVRVFKDVRRAGSSASSPES